jgi:hypothetical protein
MLSEGGTGSPRTRVNPGDALRAEWRSASSKLLPLVVEARSIRVQLMPEQPGTALTSMGLNH